MFYTKWLPRDGDIMVLIGDGGKELNGWAVESPVPHGDKYMTAKLVPLWQYADDIVKYREARLRELAIAEQKEREMKLRELLMGKTTERTRIHPGIERPFWNAYKRINPPELRGLTPQHKVGRYRIDFALPRHKIGIELDGFGHASTAAIASDRKRERDLMRAGWVIIRFGGAEIYADAAGCVREAAQLVKLKRRR